MTSPSSPVSAFIQLIMPHLFSVKRCLQAIRFILPKDTAMKVLVKWYNMYNAPGGPSMHQEWNLFVTCLMTLMGYNTERLSWTRNVSNVSVCDVQDIGEGCLLLVKLLHINLVISCAARNTQRC